MKTFASTAATATKVTLSAALAVVTVHIAEKTFGIHLNGSTAEFMGSLTVIYHAVLHHFGLNDPLSDPASNDRQPPHTST